jgi:hypothetical protein
MKIFAFKTKNSSILILLKQQEDYTYAEGCEFIHYHVHVIHTLMIIIFTKHACDVRGHFNVQNILTSCVPNYL